MQEDVVEKITTNVKRRNREKTTDVRSRSSKKFIVADLDGKTIEKSFSSGFATFFVLLHKIFS